MTRRVVPAQGRRHDPLTAAAAALSQHTDEGWSQVRSGVLQRALSVVRPSAPVRGRHEHGTFFVTTDVLVGRIRVAVDALPGGAASSITCSTDKEDELDGVVVQLVAAYGTVLLDLAAAVRRVAAREVAEVLGLPEPPLHLVGVHVHVSDVAVDPRGL